MGTCLPSDVVFLLVNAPGKDSEALQRLARIGYTRVSPNQHVHTKLLKVLNLIMSST